ncbi:hypothetical protein McpSp1_17260 [Methanocorpusculaceae archaeon Sp1]|nr:hypothetical protein [Methanocorpusculaceae archaeon Sp1]
MIKFTKKQILFCCVLCGIILLIFLLPTLFSFCFNLNSASIIYHINVDGLANISTGSLPVTILLPLPLMNNQSALPDSFYTRELDGWNSSVVSTEYGPLLSLTATTSPLKNIHASYGRSGMFVGEVPVTRLSGLKFSPETNDTATPYSLHMKSPVTPSPSDTKVEKFPPGVVVATRDPSLPAYDSRPTYVGREDIGPTLVYIPEALSDETANISILIEYQTSSKYGYLFTQPNNMIGHFSTEIIEQIPGNVSGWIPVLPQSLPSIIRLDTFSAS